MKNYLPYLIRIIIISLIFLFLYSTVEMSSVHDSQSENMMKQLKSGFAVIGSLGFLFIALIVDFIVNLVKKRKGLMIFDAVVFILLLFSFFFESFTS